MGCYSTCCLELEFKSKRDALAFVNDEGDLLPNVPNPVKDNVEVTGWYDGEGISYSVSLKETLVKMGDYKSWIPAVAKAEGLEYGVMEVTGDEPGDLWKVIFNKNRFEVQIGTVEYESITWENFI